MIRDVADLDESTVESALVYGGAASYNGEWHETYEWVTTFTDTGKVSTIRFIVEEDGNEVEPTSVLSEIGPTNGYTAEEFKNEMSNGTVIAHVSSKTRAKKMVSNHFKKTA